MASRQRLLLAIIFSLALAVALAGNWLFSASSASRQSTFSTVVANVTETSAQQQPVTFIPPPKPATPPAVDMARLMHHVQRLSYERVQNRDRARARAYITQVLTAAGWQVVEQSFGNGGVNLVADQPSAVRPVKTLLVGAHYDTVPRSPGADDNATSLATLLELARLLRPISLSAPLRLVVFDQEEIGLLGSTAFAARADNLRGLKAAVIMDMLGYACYQPGCQRYPASVPANLPNSTGDFLAVIGNEENAELLAAFITPDRAQSFQINRLLNLQYQPSTDRLPAVIALPVPLRGILTPDLLRSDHAPFWQQQIGAVLLTDTANFRSPHYHQPTDTPQHIDQAFFAKSAQLVVDATVNLLQQLQ
ncbi:MAG: M28 family peptidase [Cyanobacteria bacterium]|nr:M28 family peptidase [Cyanobacteriota bacterium]MDW8202280.1 M28 family peptidase [Cyanobacteriota bacterium SKYGB_h_bin112]